MIQIIGPSLLQDNNDTGSRRSIHLSGVHWNAIVLLEGQKLSRL